MINASDLRIGNYVSSNNSKNNIIRIDSIIEGCVNNLEPIVLTPEILEKCGFVLKNQNYNTWYALSLKGFYSTFRLLVINDIYSFSPYEWNYQIEIKSLHQLQNLYYALTGEELNFKP